MTIRVYLVEDHAMMREVLRAFLEEEADLEVCGEAASGEEALEQLAGGYGVDVVLLDVSLPRMSGIEVARELQGRRPDLACLLLSGHGEGSYVAQGLAAGARGYILKGNPAELSSAIRHVYSGAIYVSKGLRHP